MKFHSNENNNGKRFSESQMSNIENTQNGGNVAKKPKRNVHIWAPALTKLLSRQDERQDFGDQENADPNKLKVDQPTRKLPSPPKNLSTLADCLEWLLEDELPMPKID